MPGPTRVAAHLVLALGLLAPASAFAQSAAMPTCLTLLPVETLAKILGDTYQDMGSEEARGGASNCDWAVRLGTPGFKTLSFSFFDAEALKASPGYASADEYFESVVGSVESRAATKREMLSGVGLKAAFVATPPQMLVAVQRKDGVARLVGIKLTKAQMIALARALGAP